MSNTKPKLAQNFQDIALNTVSKRFATLLGIDTIPVIWNAPPLKAPRVGGDIPKYPMGYLYVEDTSIPQHIAYKKQSNAFQYVYNNNGTAWAFTLTPIMINIQFELVTDDWNQAWHWSTDLLIMRQEHKSNALLGFSTVIKDTRISIPTQVIITTDTFPVERVEFTEDVPMEYRIVGQLSVMTRATKGGIQAHLIPTFSVNSDTDPDHAVLNEDGSTSKLFSTSDGTKVFPIRLRSNLGD